MSEGDTVFGKIVRGEIPCDKVYEDDLALAFADIEPAAPTHVLVVPKQSLPSLNEATPNDAALLGHLLLVATRVMRSAGLANDGYRIVINNGPSAGQEVMHLHLHVLAGRGFGWPPG